MDRIERVAVGDLVIDPANVRQHPDKNREAIKGSLARFGQQKPIVVGADGVVVAGNGTLEAARDLGWTHLDVVRTSLTGADAIAFAIADNRTSELAEWDGEGLSRLLSSLPSLDGTGFDQTDLDALLASLSPSVPTALTDPDDVPTPPVTPVTKAGDLWMLGPHRLLCGDSTDPSNVARLMEGACEQLLITDPPYGIDYGSLVASRRNQKDGGWEDIVGDALSDDDLYALLHGALSGSKASVAFIWHPPGPRRFIFWRVVEACGWRVAQEIVWVKNALVFGRADYQWRHEPCIYAKRDGAPRQDDRTQTTVWEVDKQNASEHPTQKPIELYARAIRNHTTVGQLVYDPFGGSGTCVIAAHQNSRVARTIELYPAYVDVAARRYQEHTGTIPILEATGEEHDFTAALD